MVGKDDLANSLPIQIRGTLREMVFFFYQKHKNFIQALYYANRWLEIEPHDIEIMLQKVRCHRNLNTPLDLQQAMNIINKIESYKLSNRFYQRVLREKALIADLKGDIASAISHYQTAIELAPRNPYPEVYTGLAYLIKRDVENLPIEDTRKRKTSLEVKKLLDIARENTADFDQHHLSFYVETLIDCGEDKRAIELLDAGLLENPDDGNLCFRRAELYKSDGDYINAEECARHAIKCNYTAAHITLSTILCYKASQLAAGPQKGVLNEALKHVTLYRRREENSSYRMEVAAGIEAKIHRLNGDWDQVEAAIVVYSNSINSYTIYEQCKLEQWKAINSEVDHKYGLALDLINHSIERINSFSQRFKMPRELDDLFGELQVKREGLMLLIEND